MVSLVPLIPGGKQAVGEDDVDKLRAEFLTGDKLAEEPLQLEAIIGDAEGLGSAQDSPFFVLYLRGEGLLPGWRFFGYLPDFGLSYPAGVI
jgi:hypothetical protein